MKAPTTSRRWPGFTAIALVAVIAAACTPSTATPSAGAGVDSSAGASSMSSVAAATATPASEASTSASIAATPTATATPTAHAATPAPRAAWTPGQTVLSYDLASAGVGWVRTNRGIWETNDDGTSWVNATPAHLVLSKVRGLAGLDGSNAMLAAVDVARGHSTYYIWRTRNGGASWTYVALPPIANDLPPSPCAPGDFCGQPGDPPATFDFVDTNTAFVTIRMGQGFDGYIASTFETTNGGGTWTARNYTPSLTSIPFFGATRVQFANPSTGVAEVGDEISATTTGWGHWTTRLLDETYFSDGAVYFLADNLWAVNGYLENGTVQYHYALTTNHGAVWTPHTTAVPGLAGLFSASVQFLSANEWIGTCVTSPSVGVYDHPMTVYTSDGGVHWALEARQPFVGSQPEFADSSHGWTGPPGQLTGSGLYSTSDRGVHWRLLTP